MVFNIKYNYKRVTRSPLFKSSGIYTISNFINAAIPLLLLPILTQKLTPADYGIVAMFQLAVNAINPFVSMNLDGAICRKYYDSEQGSFPSYIGTCFFLFLISLIIVTLIGWCSRGYIHDATQIPIPWLRYIFVVAGCQFTTSVILVIYQVKVQPIKYGILQVSQTILNVGLTVFLIIWMNKKWEGRLEAQIITCVFISIVSIILLLKTKHIKFAIKMEDIKNALHFGIPLIPHTVGGVLFSGIDRFFLTKLVGLEQTGNYTVAYQIGTIIFLITLAFNNAFVPWLFENLNKKNTEINKKIVKFTYLYFIAIIFGAIILLILFPILVSIFIRGAFHTINIYSVSIVFGFAFQGMYFMVTNYISYANKTHIQAFLTIIIGLLKLPITYFAIIWFGAVGASISYCITFFLFFVITWIYSNKVYSMPWNILDVLKFKRL